MELAEWIEIYLRNRDSMEQSILSIDKQANNWTVQKKTGNMTVLVRPILEDKSFLEKVSGQTFLVVLNNKKNVDIVFHLWDELIKHDRLCIFFVNPKTNEKWILYPQTHNQITERPALRRGLDSMFEQVTEAS